MPQYAEQPGENIKSTDCATLYNDFLNQYERLVKNVDKLSTIGHKFKDTNTPQSEAKSMSPERIPGFISDMTNTVDRFRIQNNRMDEILSKLEEII